MDKVKQQIYTKKYSSLPKKYSLSEIIAYHDEHYRNGCRVAWDYDKDYIIDHNIINYSRAIV
jgi:hypothetical protein